MLIIDLLEETKFALVANKARSILTILGIVIGIGSVISMISIGQGAQSTIEENIQSLGSNLLIVTPGTQRGVGSQVRSGFGSAQSLTVKDSDAILKEISEVDAISPEISTRKQVVFKDKNTNTSIIGATSQYLNVKNIIISQGSFITTNQVQSSAKVAVLGPNTAIELFTTSTNPIGQKIKIANLIYTVIGVTETKGGNTFGSSDDAVYVPLSTVQTYITGNTVLSTINIKIKEEKLMTIAQQKIEALLLSQHNISNAALADFRIMNQADIVSAASSVTGTFTLLLGAIAGISLLVGGIGIMNMMLTTVTERTREIGLRKSLGAKRSDISTQFLSEAVILTLIGGIFGILLGLVLATAITKFGGLTTKVSINSILLAFVVSGAIGIIFGYYPARRAAQLNPIDALRYE